MWRKLAGRKAECCAAHPNIDSRSADYCAVKPYIIFNPTAGSGADAPRILAKLKRLRPSAVSITNKSGDAEKWSRQAARAGRQYIVSAGGFSGIVRNKITPEIKRSWGPLAYIRGAAAALPKLHAYKTRIVIDGREELSTAVYNVVIANGRFVAGGLPVAPEADPSDGLLDVILIPKRRPAEMALLAAEIILGKHFSSSAVIFRRARKIAVRSRPGMWF